MAKKKRNPQVNLNGREIVRVPDQDGNFMAPNFSQRTEQVVLPLPGWSKPFTPEWWGYIENFHKKHNGVENE